MCSCGIWEELPKSQSEHTWTLWKQSPEAKLLNELEGHTWSHIHDAQSHPSNAASTLEAKKKLGLSGS